MDWSTLFLGVLLGILLLPTLLMLGLRLLMWLLARKVKKLVKDLEANGGQMGGPNWQVKTFGFGLPNADAQGPVQVLDAPALLPEMTLQEQFLRKTNLSPTEWEQVKDRLVFVHDDLSINELEAMGFEPTGQGTPREQVQGQWQLLGSLDEADVYMRRNEE
ncbi:hypothetical protein ABS71_10845 [bacterium SCN 62-11]|nr:hypothetical protein [Candidatus Eremiobacteraeota bacterium]ODT67439.1 MAG: hypothetical protein ABS71_10845 [bacterium SCN 62-11]